MKYFLIVGEPSGDLHASNLMKSILRRDPLAEFCFWGGDKMSEVGGLLLRHYNTTSFFGVTQVLKNLGTILRQLKECKQQIIDFNPDCVILVDYPGFNMKIAKFAHSRGYKVCYYIAPKVWAWKRWRVKQIRKYIDRLYIIFPFERQWFAGHNVEGFYEGNPLLDSIAEYKFSMLPEFKERNGFDDRPLISLVAGSRSSEVKYNLPFMVKLSHLYPDYQFVVSGVRWLPESLYSEVVGDSDVKVIYDQTYDLMHHSCAAIVTSGTATLEVALIGTPQVVVYKTDPITGFFANLAVRIPYISLVNLNLQKEAVKEFLLGKVQIPAVSKELKSLLQGSRRRQILKDYASLVRIMGAEGCSQRIADNLVTYLKDGE